MPPKIELRRFAGPEVHSQQLDHVRVAHLTDLHVGRVTPFRVQMAAAELCNAQQPDLVVMSGDFVAHSQAFLDQLTEVVAAFAAPVIGVLGNHDHWSGADEVRWALRRGGAEVLDNAWTTVTVRGQKLQVVGLDDAYTGHHDIERAVRGLDRNAPSIGISHIAEEADALWERGVPIVFSGHTHAGQVTLARLHEFILGRVVGHRYIHGLYGARGNHGPGGSVYVGAGIGSAVMPVRIGERAKREVAVFELGHEIGTYDEHHEEQAAHPGRAPSEEVKRKRWAESALKSQRRRAAAKKRGIDPLNGG
jgi:predicted MPP superfamily phosphohydrolase